jgi:glycosyltransferase 2 family protein
VSAFAGIRIPPRVLLLVRLGVGAGILMAVVLVVGADSFVKGVAAVSPIAVAAAVALAGIATAAAAWRWCIVARRLGVPLRWRSAAVAYYRSQLLNSVLPGGVLGDVHRAVAHGREAERPGDAARAVVAERAAGQLVQMVLAVAVIGAVGIRLDDGAITAAALALAAIAAAALTLAVPAVRRVVRRELARSRVAFGSPGAVAAVVASSVIVLAAHTATFVVACIATGSRAEPARLVLVSMVAVLGSAVPLGVGGWGPRESIAAWAFAAAGMGASAGVAASVAFGVLATIAVLPGLVVLAVPRLAQSTQADAPRRDVAAPAVAAKDSG